MPTHEDWPADVHALRLQVFECTKLCERLTVAISAQRMPADLASLVEATRSSVLTAMRVAHLLELGATVARQAHP